MDCYECKRPAHAICIFCGRAVCQKHANFKPAVKNIFRNKNNQLQAFVVEGGIWCGKCKPYEYPIDITEIEKFSPKTDDSKESASNPTPEITEQTEQIEKDDESP